MSNVYEFAYAALLVKHYGRVHCYAQEYFAARHGQGEILEGHTWDPFVLPLWDRIYPPRDVRPPRP